MALYRYMVIDEDGQRVGRVESDNPEWRVGDTFSLDERMWRLVEILPEVSTMVAYNAVWIAAPAAERDERHHGHSAPPAAPQREISSAAASG